MSKNNVHKIATIAATAIKTDQKPSKKGRSIQRFESFASVQDSSKQFYMTPRDFIDSFTKQIKN